MKKRTYAKNEINLNNTYNEENIFNISLDEKDISPQLKNEKTDKIKNVNEELSDIFMNEIDFGEFNTSEKSKIKWRTRFSKFLNIYNTIHYFTQPK